MRLLVSMLSSVFLLSMPAVAKPPLATAAGGAGQQSKSYPLCTPDALTPADRERMQAEYSRRIRATGKASAEAWLRDEAQRFRTKLEDQGVCPPRQGQTPPAAVADKGRKKPLLGKNGKPCRKTRVENRVMPGLGGAPMSLGLVTVCAD